MYSMLEICRVLTTTRLRTRALDGQVCGFPRDFSNETCSEGLLALLLAKSQGDLKGETPRRGPKLARILLYFVL